MYFPTRLGPLIDKDIPGSFYGLSVTVAVMNSSHRYPFMSSVPQRYIVFTVQQQTDLFESHIACILNNQRLLCSSRYALCDAVLRDRYHYGVITSTLSCIAKIRDTTVIMSPPY